MYRGGRCELRKRKREVSREFQSSIDHRWSMQMAADYAGGSILGRVWVQETIQGRAWAKKINALLDGLSRKEAAR